MEHSTPTSTAIHDDAALDSRDSANKRPAWDDANDRSSKRRAAKACLSCRSRKVRCDVMERGKACTNCCLDGIECLVTESNRGKKPMPSTITVAVPQSPILAASAGNHGPAATSTSSRGEPQNQAQAMTPLSSGPADDLLVSLSFEDQSPHENQRASVSRSMDIVMQNPSPSVTARPTTSASSYHINPPLPSYIKPFPPRFTATDIEYLDKKGALFIPNAYFRDQLLRTYIRYVHPFMPVLELNEFLGCIFDPDNPETPRKQVSLLVFQAVMFASTTFVDVKVLQGMGYKDRREAREAFFRRVRLLYGLDSELDRVSLIQALLLMTSWYNGPEDEKDTWYWMGIALTLAQVGGLHHDPQNLMIPAREKRRRRRLWWCCVARDRLLALGVRRPSRIQPDTFNVPALTIDDIDTTALSDAIVQQLGETEAGFDQGTRRALATIFVDLSQLCVCLGHILHSQYTTLSSPSLGSSYLSKVIVMPKRSKEQREELVKCDSELAGWLEGQDKCSKYAVATVTHSPGDQILHLHQALLHMVYLQSVIVLHRPQVFHAGLNSDADRKAAKQKVTSAANAMAALASDLESQDTLRFLSTSSVPAFLSAILLHLLDARSPVDDVRNLSIGRLYQCVHVLRELQDMYASADYAVHFLGMVLKRTEIRIPLIMPILSILNQKDRAGSGTTETDPTLLGSGNRLVTAEDDNREDEARPDTQMHLLSYDPWSGGAEILGANNQETLNIITDLSPYLSTWSDLDNLIPPYINFNSL